MPPAEGGVRVDDNVLGLVGEAKNVFEDAAAEAAKPRDGQVEDAAGSNLGCFGIHAAADVAYAQLLAGLLGKLDDLVEIRGLVEADGAGDDGSHKSILPQAESDFQRQKQKAGRGRQRLTQQQRS